MGPVLSRRVSAGAPVSRLFVPLLIYIGLVTAVVSSLGAPLIPTIAHHDHVTLNTAQWSLTIALLSGAVTAPVMGRLGDGPYRRETTVIGLGVVMAGGAVAALAGGIAVLLVGRAMQGVGLGLVSLTMAMARDHLAAERGRSVIAALSVTTAGGVGLGYPLSGLIAEHLGLHAAFWFGAIVAGCALGLALVVLPSSRAIRAATVDLPGALILALALVGLLLAISEGSTWGWRSGRIVGLLAASAVLLGAWGRHELRTATPIVDLRLVRHRAVLTADLVGLMLGVAMYSLLPLMTQFVQTPRRSGYGFSASVVVAGLMLLPLSAGSLVASRAIAAIGRIVGAQWVLPAGCVLCAGGSLLFALSHAALWEAFLTLGVVGLGLGLSFAAMPGLIVRNVPGAETGSAMGFYQVARYVGFSLGSALSASILTAQTTAGASFPGEGGYVTALSAAAGLGLAAAIVAAVLPGRPTVTGRSAIDEKLLADFELEEGELGGAGVGFVGPHFPHGPEGRGDTDQ
jgi:MFS family permease